LLMLLFEAVIFPCLVSKHIYRICQAGTWTGTRHRNHSFHDCAFNFAWCSIIQVNEVRVLLYYYKSPSLPWAKNTCRTWSVITMS
jgi:hypothetical protein